MLFITDIQSNKYYLMTPSIYNRRSFIYTAGMHMGWTVLTIQGLSALTACGSNSPEKREEKQEMQEAEKKLGIALVGLGGYSEGQLAPALKETKHCELRGIVTGSDEKARRWKEAYNLPDNNIYNYQNFDSIKDNPDIDIVYVVLPNSMHTEYTI